jgi:Domain of unknown function (DUF4114)/Vanadium chloroperoxidase N-terminal domain
MENLTGTIGVADRFVVTQAGSTIAGFNYAEGDRIIIRTEGATTSETVTNFDLVNPLANIIAGYPSAITATATGVELRIPDFDGIGSQSFVTINTADLAASTALATLLANSSSANVSATGTTPGSSAFLVQSKGNTVVEWNDITFDSARMAGVPPAASTRYFALVHTAINDAVQGIVNVAGRQTYLQSQGINLAPPATGANADIAAAAAGRAILSVLYTDSNNPAGGNAFTPSGGTATTVRAYYPGLFTAALDAKIAEARDGGATQASIDAGIAYGNAVARNLLGSRQTDGYLLNADGTQVNIAELSASYRDGIENTEPGEARNAASNGTVGILANGTSLIGTAASISAVSSAGVRTINSTAVTTPGAWRRGEDTLSAAGQFAGLASPEVASINQTWFLPTTNFFGDIIGSPPALDSQRYIDNVAEVRNEGSLLDLPGTGDVTLNNRSTTVNGVTTSIGGPSVLGARVNDIDIADTAYPNAVGSDAPPNLPRTQPDGIGTTSAERTIIAHVWANAEGSYGPNYAYQKIAQQLAINNNDSLADSAYRFALLDVAFADGFATLWDAKWDKDYFWRPVSSVRNADQLASTASLDDNAWTPRENTPQHPCHPSGTSASAGLATTLLASFYGENANFVVSADVNGNSARLNGALTDTNADGRNDVNGVALEEVSRNYTSFSQVREETRLSRIYAGAHFRFATERGVELGTDVANYLLANNPFLAPSSTAPATGVFRAASALEAQTQARWLSSGNGNYEFGFITVDNAAGNIDGLAADNAAYAQTALKRKNVLFDGRSQAGTGAVRNSNLSNLATSEAQSAGQVASADLIGNTIYYLTENGVTTFSNSAGGRFSSSSVGGLNQIAFRDSQNQDVRFEVGAAFPAYRSAGAPGGARANVAVSISRAAALNDSVGLYAVDDAQGCFDTNGDSYVDLRVGQQGYLQEALRRAALNPGLTQATANNTSVSSNISVDAGRFFGLLLVADGTIAQASTAGSTLNVFSSFTGANTDNKNHVVRLGNGTTEVFGFEDRLGGGDNDFNDLIVSITRAA